VHTGDVRQAFAQELAHTPVVGNYRGPAHLGKGVDRSVQRHCTNYIRRTGFLAIGRSRPDNFAKLDKVDRAAAARNGSPSAKVLRGPMSTPAPKGAYIL